MNPDKCPASLALRAVTDPMLPLVVHTGHNGVAVHIETSEVTERGLHGNSALVNEGPSQGTYPRPRNAML